MKTISYRDALREALSEEMERDSQVIMLGEDIGRYGGGFGVTAGLIDRFGKERVLDTPISEAAFVGVAIGSAMTGLRPVVEMMFSDFMGVCFDQIVNEAAKFHFIYNGLVSVPIVIRSAAGAGTGASAQHSQSQEAIFCHIPGLKVVVPSTPYDAKGLLKTAVRDDNPVIFMEQKLLYNTVGEIPEEEYLVPFGKADIKRKGSDISLITYGRMTQMCLEAAEELSVGGIDAEVLDLRSLSPLDTDSIIKSVCRTGRALVVHEAVCFGGFGAEVVSEIAEHAFGSLKCAVRRLGGAYSPVPGARIPERNSFPTRELIIDTVRAMTDR